MAAAEKRVRRPSMAQLEEWMEEGGCEATDGCWVEPDGECEHGCEMFHLVGLLHVYSPERIRELYQQHRKDARGYFGPLTRVPGERAEVVLGYMPEDDQDWERTARTLYQVWDEAVRKASVNAFVRADTDGLGAVSLVFVY